MTVPQLLFSASDVCEALKIKKTMLYKLVKEGRLAPPLEISSRKKLWKLDDLKQFIDSLPRSESLEDEDVEDDTESE